MARQHPNVLWLFCDQLRYHGLSCNGDSNIETPNIDRLARQGAGFTNACTCCPVGEPGRGAGRPQRNSRLRKWRGER